MGLVDQTAYGANWNGTLPADAMATFNTGFFFPTDVQEADKMSAYTPSAPTVTGQQPANWWESLVMYGATRAIDNRFPSQPVNVLGNTDPGSIAGQNGRTYMVPGWGGVIPGASVQAGARQVSAPQVQQAGMPLLLGAVLLLVLLGSGTKGKA